MPLVRANFISNAITRLIGCALSSACFRVNDGLPHAGAELRMIFSHDLVANSITAQNFIRRTVFGRAVLGEHPLTLVVLVVEAFHHLAGFFSASTDAVTERCVEVLQSG